MGIKLFTFLGFLFIINGLRSYRDDIKLNQVKSNEDIQLPEPQKTGGITLMEALHKRKSDNNFDKSKSLTLQQLSNIMWASYGPNRDDGHKTVPSALAMYPLKYYVFSSTGVYLYDPSKNILSQLLEGDYRNKTGTQEFVKYAAVNIVIIGDYNAKSSTSLSRDERYKLGLLDSTHSSQNVYLYAASENLKCRVRAMIDHDVVLKLLNLSNENYFVCIAISVGP